MNEDVKKLWVTALENSALPDGTPLTQTTGYLTVIADSDLAHAGDCCLGVLCRLGVLAGVVTAEPNTMTVVYRSVEDPYTDADEATLPWAVREWAGIDVADEGSGEEAGEGVLPVSVRSLNPEKGRDDTFTTLASLNDMAKFTFAEIAEVVREQF